MKDKTLLNGLGSESTHLNQNCKLSDMRLVKRSSNAVASGAGSKGLFLCGTMQKDTEWKISQSLRDTDNGAGSKGLFSINIYK